MTRFALIAQHAARWGFRPRGPLEDAAAYVDAAIAFLERYDWAAAHEVRVGRVQAEWTPADVADFSARRMGPRWPRAPRPVAAVLEQVDADQPCTLVTLRGMAWAALEALAGHRQRDVAASLPIILAVLTLDGRVLATMPNSDERIDVLRAIAQREPVYGYALVFDAFVHNITDDTATKRDALLAHLGTRDGARHILQRRYTVAGRRVTFEPETDLDVRAEAAPDGTMNVTDPYAEVFVTVPPPARPQ